MDVDNKKENEVILDNFVIRDSQMPEDKIFNFEITVRYDETDKMGIVHNSKYFIYYDMARASTLDILGIDFVQLDLKCVFMAVASHDAKYIKPANFADVLRMETKVIKQGFATTKLEHKIFKDDVCINSCVTNTAWVDKELKPINLSKNFPKLYQRLKEAEYGKPGN